MSYKIGEAISPFNFLFVLFNSKYLVIKIKINKKYIFDGDNYDVCSIISWFGWTVITIFSSFVKTGPYGYWLWMWYRNSKRLIKNKYRPKQSKIYVQETQNKN